MLRPVGDHSCSAGSQNQPPGGALTVTRRESWRVGMYVVAGPAVACQRLSRSVCMMFLRKCKYIVVAPMFIVVELMLMFVCSENSIAIEVCVVLNATEVRLNLFVNDVSSQQVCIRAYDQPMFCFSYLAQQLLPQSRLGWGTENLAELTFQQKK